VPVEPVPLLESERSLASKLFFKIAAGIKACHYTV